MTGNFGIMWNQGYDAQIQLSGLLVKFLSDPGICNIQVRIENAVGSLCATTI